MPTLRSPFKTPEGEAQIMAAYDATLKLWTVPFEAMDIPSRFGVTHLAACGPAGAPPLVLLHAFLASLTMWAYNMADLSRDYRVYALDVLGQPGKSVPGQPMLSREDFVEWLTAVLDALKIEQTHLSGMSYGGWIALNYAMRAPGRLKKVVLLSPAGSFLPIVPQFYMRGMLLSLPPGRHWTESFMGWMTYRDNLREAGVITTQYRRPIRRLRFVCTSSIWRLLGVFVQCNEGDTTTAKEPILALYHFFDKWQSQSKHRFLDLHTPGRTAGRRPGRGTIQPSRRAGG